MNYNNEKLWGAVDAGNNLGAELKKDSIFLAQWDIGPMPMAFTASGLTWFNDVKALAGFIKYQLLKGHAFLMFGYEDEFTNPENTSLEEYLDHDLTGDEWNQNAQSELRRECELIDKVFESDDEKGMEIIRECLENFNSFFNSYYMSAGAELLMGHDELLALFNDEERMGHYSDTEDFIQEILELLEFGKEGKLQ